MTRLVYNTDGLSCGAKAYIETLGFVSLTDPMSYKEAKADA